MDIREPSWLHWLLIAAVIILVLLPPKYDPAIRLKEWVLKKRDEDD